MSAFTWRISDLLFENHLLRERIAALESGERFTRMQEEHCQEISFLDRLVKSLKSKLAEAHAETVNVRKKWIQTCDDVRHECDLELKRMQTQVRRAEKAAEEARQQRDEAKQAMREAFAESYRLRTELDAEKEKNQALAAQLHRDYTNSSKPSSMSPNHKTIHNGREKTGKKPGGQKGHPHHGRTKQTATRKVNISPYHAFLNPILFRPTGKVITKQMISAQLTVIVTEYSTPEYLDLLTGHTIHAHFPQGVVDDVNYDASVKALAYLLNNECNVSVNKTQSFLREISGGKLDLSAGMICNLARQFSQKTTAERQEIFDKHLNAPILHADFSFARKMGKQTAVIITATNDSVLYQAREKKGHEGVAGSPLEKFNNILVSDHEAALICHGSRRQECMSHIRRHDQSSIELEPNLTWSLSLLEWIKKSIHHWKGYIPDDPSWPRKSEQLISELRQILRKAREEYEYEPPSEYFQDGYNLYKRMEEDFDSYVLFLRDPSVPPTNNLAERHARRYKRKAHQVMSFRGEMGDAYYCDGLTIIESLKARDVNLFEGIQERFAIPFSKQI